ncbi:hypothetical protein VP01_118g5 [Puccinia sorghi]|uniref:Uncharacterized protein n=1 Tax=Puccinia sorghi TaxID=27349 RepID=A0A0L6VQX4_9BASI|nr:hypothetical protein VP01_118g5 [Puccinia sorghi]
MNHPSTFHHHCSRRFISSNAANIFFQLLDLMSENHRPIPSKIFKIPQSLPLEFYHYKWLQNLPLSQQHTIPDLTQEAFSTIQRGPCFPSTIQHMTKLNDYLIVSSTKET